MSEDKIYPVRPDFAATAHVKEAEYTAMYQRSVDDPDGFWAEQAEKFVTWFKPWEKVQDWSYDQDDLHIEWFKGGKLNVSYNCLDRHLETRGDQTAIIWEGDNPAEDRKITYRELHADVSRFANVLKAKGVKKGDRVCIYMPMIPEAAVAMLACTRIGAVHSIVFGGFSPDSLRDRILDSDCRTVITSDYSLRGGKQVPLKKNADKALAECPNVSTLIVVRRTGGDVAWVDGRDCWYDEEMGKVSADCPPEEMDAEDPLFILYTSGSTGKPKGVLHTTGGYKLYNAITHKYVFDYHDDDIYWCTADVGWVTG
ncbi:MAG: AMP-binding protein, partial [Chromatiales bacterium]|nr:AMP-binding protein [Chromatiales bacterium]